MIGFLCILIANPVWELLEKLLQSALGLLHFICPCPVIFQIQPNCGLGSGHAWARDSSHKEAGMGYTVEVSKVARFNGVGNLSEEMGTSLDRIWQRGCPAIHTEIYKVTQFKEENMPERPGEHLRKGLRAQNNTLYRPGWHLREELSAESVFKLGLTREWCPFSPNPHWTKFCWKGNR